MKKKQNLNLFLSIIFSNSLSNTIAQDTIFVEAEKLPYSIKEAYQKIHLLNEEDIASSNAQSLSDLLSTLPQIHAVNRGGKGQNGSLFIRGLDSYHTVVVLDGIVMNDPTDPNRAFNFNELNIADIEKIEILKGAQAQLYGANSMGGVIYIRTKRAAGNKTKNLFTQNSSYNNKSFNDHAFSLSHRDKMEKLNYKISGSIAQNGNQSALIKNQNSEEKDKALSKNLNLNLDYEINNKQLIELSAIHKNLKADYDETSPLNPNANNQLTHIESGANINHSGLWTESLSSEFQASTKTNERNLFASSKYHYSGKENRSNLYLLWQSSSLLDFSLGNHFYSEQITFNEGNGIVKKYQKSFAKSLSFQKKSQQEDSPWFLSANIRLENPDITKNHFTYRIVSGLNLAKNEVIKTSFTKGANNPSLYALYGFGGNTELKPEVSYQGEVSYESQLNSKYVFSLIYFQTYFQEKFQYNSSSSRMENIGGARIEGLESELAFKGENEIIKLSASYLDALAINQSKKLAYRPKTMTKLTFSRYLDEASNISFYFRAIGKQFDSGERELTKYTLLDLSYAHNFNTGLTVEIYLKNILNEGYVTETNFSESGRTLGLKTVYDF